MRSINLTVLDAATQTAAATYPSDGTAISGLRIDKASIAGTISGASSPVGTLKLQASNDKAPGNGTLAFSPTNWADVPSGSVTFGTNETLILPPVAIAYRWLRVVWTPASGTGGTITATFHGTGPA